MNWTTLLLVIPVAIVLMALAAFLPVGEPNEPDVQLLESDEL